MAKVPAYPNLEGLVDLACRDGVDIRPTLLRVLTDLYVQKPSHSAAEEAQYTELALQLLGTVDTPTQAAVAAKLKTYPRTPRAILDTLGIAKTAAAAAKPASQAAARLPPAGGRTAALELTELFYTATPYERWLILTNFHLADPAPSIVPAQRSDDAMRRLELAALRHDSEGFVRELSDSLDLSRAQVRRMVEDATGEPIVVAAKALAMPAAMLQRILLFLNPAVGHSVQRVYDLATLYDEMSEAAATRMVEIWRQADGHLPNPAYQPQYRQDRAVSARRAATPGQYHLAGLEELPPPFEIAAR